MHKSFFSCTKYLLLLFGFLLFSNFVCLAQNYDPPPGTIVHNNDLNKFLGSWQWVNGIDTVRFKLNKENIVLPNTTIGGMDFIIGYHLYKQGNVTIESSIQYAGYTFAGGHNTITGLEPTGPGFKTIRITLQDLSKNKDDHFDLTLDNTNTQMQCTGALVAGGVHFGTAPPPGYTLPGNMIMIKLPPPPPMGDD